MVTQQSSLSLLHLRYVFRHPLTQFDNHFLLPLADLEPSDRPLLEMNGLDEFKSFLRRILDHKFCSLTKLNITASIVSNFPIPRDINNVVSSQNHMDSSIKIQNNPEQLK
ncbi:hypothetical protein H5410_051025 [Solanum commersonii]|uniref:Uncharacterized protein n=1 Tax=Solanum commersonii TaxID=4109 RepID=A0A9J5WZI5_SOLCO|nr:hypothetical protein H5410_051025 [Solanum commersonii]